MTRKGTDWLFGLGAASVIAVVLVICLAVAGWLMNVNVVIHSNFTQVTGELIIRVIGIVIPFIGAVMGWV